jgi:Outer membrane protein beta-barrel domain
MKKFLLPILMLTNAVAWGQSWQAELQAGVAGYSGDLNSKALSVHNMGPGITLNAKYKLDEELFLIRAGVSWGKIGGDDKYNTKAPELVARNLNFKSNIIEANICLEVNVLSPELFDVYPYVFAGVGVFHFNPYSYNKKGEKVFLQPLGTEGEGLPDYPDRKVYSLTQLCFPFGGGVKMKVNEQWDVAFEVGYRKLLTDHLDDVGNTYANPEIILTGRGPATYEMAYRGAPSNIPQGGEVRGNSKKKDWYYFTGIKLIWKFRSRDQIFTND